MLKKLCGEVSQSEILEGSEVKPEKSSRSETLTKRDGKARKVLILYTQEASSFRSTVSCSKSFAGKSLSEILEGIGVKPEKSLVLMAGRRYG